MIYVWAREHVEEPEQWAAGLVAPLPGRRRRVTARDLAQEAADFQQLQITTGR